MLTEDQAAAIRGDTQRVRSRLQRLIANLPPQGRAQPAQLTIAFSTGSWGWYAAAMFVYMANAAVARKYEQAGRRRVAAELYWLSGFAARSYQNAEDWSPYSHRLPGIAHMRTQRLVMARRRLAQHATRTSCGDRDLELCRASYWGFGSFATPWVCQQADWRYRWTQPGRARLQFMLDCWDAYCRCGFGSNDLLIGFADFPLSQELRPDLCP